MDITPRGLLRNWVPRTPSLAATAIRAILGRSENTAEQDWAIEVIVAAARPILQTPSSLLQSQLIFNIDHGVWGHTWVSTYTVPAPISQPQSHALTLNKAVAFAITTLAQYPHEVKCDIPPFNKSGVEAEWTSYRTQARPWTRPPNLSQQQIYNASLADTPEGEESPVILYAHGGAFCLMDPANHRFNTVDLARKSHARLLSVRYRLSPQAIFPAALMDLFLCYLALLAPPPASFHAAVPAHRIILAGDSSGGNLATALQVLLTTLVQHGRTEIANPWGAGTIGIPEPPSGGLSLSSPWLDVTRSLPSQRMNAQWDFIAPASVLHADLLSTSPMFPADEIWPSKPVRTETYCEATVCAHPLVSPLTTPSHILRDFPSTYICAGWEGMTDESQVLARRIWTAKYGSRSPSRVARKSDDLVLDSGYASAESRENAADAVDAEVMFDGFTGMPHTFSIIPLHRAGEAAKVRRAAHIRRMTGGRPARGSSASWSHSKTMVTESWKFGELAMVVGRDSMSGYERMEALTDEVVLRAVCDGAAFRIELEKRLRQQQHPQEQSKHVLTVRELGLKLIQAFLWAIVFRVRDVVFLIMYWVLWTWMQM